MNQPDLAAVVRAVPAWLAFLTLLRT